MNNKLGVVAWIAATVLSVAASTAAVASVREQVTDSPELVSLAALRRAVAIDPSNTTSPQLEALPDEPAVITALESATTVATSTTTRPEVVAVPETIVETTTTSTPPTTQPPETATAKDGDDGRDHNRGRGNDEPREESRDFHGGSVTVAWDGDQLELVDAVTEDGYQYVVEGQSDREISLRFFRDDRRPTSVLATFNNGGLQIRVFD